MSMQSDNQMLEWLGVPEGFGGLAPGCSRTQPYMTGDGPDVATVNRGIEANNNRGHADWMGWCNE